VSIIGKNCNGESDQTVMLNFYGQYSRFEDYAPPSGPMGGSMKTGPIWWVTIILEDSQPIKG
jgi:hypothetical protein